jgi:hypothetical protein
MLCCAATRARRSGLISKQHMHVVNACIAGGFSIPGMCFFWDTDAIHAVSRSHDFSYVLVGWGLSTSRIRGTSVLTLVRIRRAHRQPGLSCGKHARKYMACRRFPLALSSFIVNLEWAENLGLCP